MIDHLLQPLICEWFLTDARYREGHLRVVNALPKRRIMRRHSPEIKQVVKEAFTQEWQGCDTQWNVPILRQWSRGYSCV
ncbi:MAG: hypothetical protein IKD24_08550 [Alistipes sp.]|nr:hypothetical protein [Alistipes sp.]